MLVIGNGESRKNISIEKLHGVKIGCNAIARDFIVDHLVCVDRRMVTEALNNNFQNTIYTRKDWIGQFNKSQEVKPPFQLNLTYEFFQNFQQLLL